MNDEAKKPDLMTMARKVIATLESLTEADRLKVFKTVATLLDYSVEPAKAN